MEWELRNLKRYEQVATLYPGMSILDLGCAMGEFVAACMVQGYKAEGIGTEVNFESDDLPCTTSSYDCVHLNAVLEHIHNPSHLMTEIHRILKPHGILIVNTPNWAIDLHHFYDDPTHVHPYTPTSLRMLLKMYGFNTLLCEPALITPSILWWKVPWKWTVCSLLWRGSKSILLIANKTA